LICVSSAVSQNRIIDSLQIELKKAANNDTLKANVLNEISKRYLYDFNNMDKMKQYAALAVQLAQKSTYKKGLGYGYVYYGIFYYNQGNYEYALTYYNKALKLLQEVGDQRGMGSCYINIGSIYGTKGDYNKALTFMLKGAKLKEAAKDKRGTSAAYNNIGNMYSDQGKYPEAISYHMKSLKLKEEINDKVGVSISYNNIGLILEIQGKIDEAIAYQFKSLKIKEELDDKQGVSVAYSNLATLYLQQKKFEESLAYCFKSLKLKEELGEKQGEALVLSNIGATYTAMQKSKEALKYELKALKIMEDIGVAKDIVSACIAIGNSYESQKQYPEALPYYEKALSNSKKIDYRDGIKEAYRNLSSIHTKLKNYQKALEYNVLFYEEKDSLLNKEVMKQVTEINTKYQTEKKEQEIQLLTKDQQLKDKTLREQRVIRIALIAGLSLFLILSFTLYNRYRFKQRANTLLEKQKKEIEEQNILITDSIDYAKTIQEAVFPSEARMQFFFPDSFVLYKPKAIVSGDFYQVIEKHNKIICTVADCTGHGIPGAFMSLLGFNMLENIVEKQDTIIPSVLLTELNQKMVTTMSQNPSDDTSVKHGMDATMIVIDSEAMELQFAGAHNSLYHIRDNKLNEIKADKMSIGSYKDSKSVEFRNHVIPIQKGDVFYLFSDGFPDQIGGPNRKKFYYPPFKELLLSIHASDVQEQKNILDRTIINWRGERDQTDDILIVGIRI
jgi:serine phosphatase RsbU (regulator of sigma subunit)